MMIPAPPEIAKKSELAHLDSTSRREWEIIFKKREQKNDAPVLHEFNTATDGIGNDDSYSDWMSD